MKLSEIVLSLTVYIVCHQAIAQRDSDRKALKVRRSECPIDKPYVDCSVISPCKAEKLLKRNCEAHPKAICINDYCGGCVAKHYVNREEVFCGKERNVICELQNTSLSCPVNKVMIVKSANYGRTNPYTCRHSYNFDSMHNNTRCYSENSTAIARELCEGRTICSPDVSSQIFGDPCHGIYKYLEVDFICVPVQNYLTYKSVDRESSSFERYISSGTSHTLNSALLWLVIGTGLRINIFKPT